MADGFWSNLWNAWFRQLSADCIKTASILGVLYLYWEALVWLRFRGYPAEHIERLESVHFNFMWAALVVLGANFVIKLAISLWREK